MLGEREEATALAERAEALATRWGMMAYLRWFAERNRLGSSDRAGYRRTGSRAPGARGVLTDPLASHCLFVESRGPAQGRVPPSP